MPQEKTEIVRRVYEAAARRDSAAVLSLHDPEVEIDNTRLGLVDHAGSGEGTRSCGVSSVNGMTPGTASSTTREGRAGRLVAEPGRGA